MYSWPHDLVWKMTMLAIGRQKFNEFCNCIALHLRSFLHILATGKIFGCARLAHPSLVSAMVFDAMVLVQIGCRSN